MSSNSHSLAREGTTIDELPLTLTVEEAAKLLRIGRSAAYAAVHSGDLPTIKVGRTFRVSRDRLIALLQGA
jgi:excisionase family DNA binding protein